MTVDVPEGELSGFRVSRFTIERDDLQNMRNAMDGRGTPPGTYTRLSQQLPNGGWRTWMSDTHAEQRDHFEAAYQISSRGGQVLLGGLGLGMVLNVALHTEGVTHVDVVEIESAVIDLVGPHYQKIAADRGVSLVIHHGDMLKIKWPRGIRWDVAWFDIWGDLNGTERADMTKLRRSYGQRTGWNDCWGRWLLDRRW
jgi:hypothetical protein